MPEEASDIGTPENGWIELNGDSISHEVNVISGDFLRHGHEYIGTGKQRLRLIQIKELLTNEYFNSKIPDDLIEESRGIYSANFWRQHGYDVEFLGSFSSTPEAQITFQSETEKGCVLFLINIVGSFRISKPSEAYDDGAFKSTPFGTYFELGNCIYNPKSIRKIPPGIWYTNGSSNMVDLLTGSMVFGAANSGWVLHQSQHAELPRQEQIALYKEIKARAYVPVIQKFIKEHGHPRMLGIPKGPSKHIEFPSLASGALIYTLTKDKLHELPYEDRSALNWEEGDIQIGQNVWLS